jgi:hypothetical protein
MRYFQILLEYSRRETIKSYGPRILQALTKDISVGIEDLKKLAETNPEEAVNQILNKLEQADSTVGDIYVRWLVIQYIKNHVKLEDLLSRGADALGVFHQAKNRKMLKNTDINAYNFNQLEELKARLEQQIALKDKKKQEMEDRGKFQEWDTPKVRIIRVDDETASKFWGRKTQWCIAAKNNNMFDFYHKHGRIYYFIPKFPEHEDEKYAIAIGDTSARDEHDDPVDNKWVLKNERWDLLPLFKKIEPLWLIYYYGGDLQDRINENITLIEQVSPIGDRTLALVNSNNGEMIIDDLTGVPDGFKDGLLRVFKSGGVGFINETGELVIDFPYRLISNFQNGFAIVNDYGKLGYINKKGDLVFGWLYGPFGQGGSYQTLYPFGDDGFAKIINKYDVPEWIDREGNFYTEKPH